MTDVVDPAKRSLMMAGIRGKHTKPELTVRGMLHAAGFRFRLHRKDLPGKPDLVLPKYRAVILVHGCFWHAHVGCRLAAVPVSNSEFWQAKLNANRERDRRQLAELRSLGWSVLVVWECATRSATLRSALQPSMARWLTSDAEFDELPPAPSKLDPLFK